MSHAQTFVELWQGAREAEALKMILGFLADIDPECSDSFAVLMFKDGSSAGFSKEGTRPRQAWAISAAKNTPTNQLN